MLRDKIFIMLAAVFVSGFVVNECSAADAAQALRDARDAKRRYESAMAGYQVAKDGIETLNRQVQTAASNLEQAKRDAASAASRDAVAQAQRQLDAYKSQVQAEIQKLETEKQALKRDIDQKKREMDESAERLKKTLEKAHREATEQAARAYKETQEKAAEAARKLQDEKIAHENAAPAREAAMQQAKREQELANHLNRMKIQTDNAEQDAMLSLKREALKGSALRKGTPTAEELEATSYSDEDGYDYEELIRKVEGYGDRERAQSIRERRQIQQSMADFELFKRSAEISAEAKMLEDKEIQAYEAALLPKRIAAQAAKDIQEQRVAEVAARETALMNNKFKPLEYKNNKEMLKMKLEGLMNLAKMVGDGFTPKNVALAAAGIGGTYGLVKLLGVGSRQLERILKQPVLVRHSSQGGPLTKLMRSIFPKKSDHATYHLSDMILNPELAKKLERVSNMIKLAQQHGAPLPGVVAYGLPGNGKTMFMEALANDSGMNFAMMTGGDVSALLSSGGKNAAVTEIHKLFDWAITAGPTLLFIDEADAFLKKGRDAKLSEGLAAAINAFLNRTGASSNKVMIVLATNHPHVFDEAVASRMSIWINFPAPGFNERAKMYVKFLDDVVNEGVGDDHTPVVIVPEARSENFVQEVAKRTDGYSGRDMTRKIFDSLQREMLAEGKFQVDRSLIMQTLNEIDAQEKELNSFNTVGNNGSSFVNNAAAIAA